MTEHRELYEKGIELFNDEQFYECHDTLEEIWLEDCSSDRLFYQGLIQAAVGFYHVTNGKLGAARSMMSKALEKLTRYPNQHRGVDLALFVDQLQEWKAALDEAIRSQRQPATCPFPTLVYAPDKDV